MNQTIIENPLTGYLNERFNTLNTYLFNTINFPAEEDVHQMRVEIKKLNALIRMLESVIEEFEIKQLRKSLSRIFKAAGKLREDHINTNLAIQYQIDLGTENNNSRKLKEAKHADKLKTRLELFLKSEWEDLQQQLTDLVVRIDPETVEQSALQFLNAEFELINQLYPEKHNGKVLHKIRMHLKASGYIISLISELNSERNWEEFYNQVKTTESLIGTWHDHVGFRQMLLKIEKLNSDTNQKEQINKVLDILEKDTRVTINEIYHQLSSVIENQPVLN